MTNFWALTPKGLGPFEPDGFVTVFGAIALVGKQLVDDWQDNETDPVIWRTGSEIQDEYDDYFSRLIRDKFRNRFGDKWTNLADKFHTEYLDRRKLNKRGVYIPPDPGILIANHIHEMANISIGMIGGGYTLMDDFPLYIEEGGKEISIRLSADEFDQLRVMAEQHFQPIEDERVARQGRWRVSAEWLRQRFASSQIFGVFYDEQGSENRVPVGTWARDDPANDILRGSGKFGGFVVWVSERELELLLEQSLNSSGQPRNDNNNFRQGTPAPDADDVSPDAESTSQTPFQIAVQAEVNKLRDNAKLKMAAFKAAARLYPDGELPTSPAQFAKSLMSADELNLGSRHNRSRSWSRWLSNLRDIAGELAPL